MSPPGFSLVRVIVISEVSPTCTLGGAKPMLARGANGNAASGPTVPTDAAGFSAELIRAGNGDAAWRCVAAIEVSSPATASSAWLARMNVAVARFACDSGVPSVGARRMCGRAAGRLRRFVDILDPQQLSDCKPQSGQEPLGTGFHATSGHFQPTCEQPMSIDMTTDRGVRDLATFGELRSAAAQIRRPSLGF